MHQVVIHHCGGLSSLRSPLSRNRVAMLWQQEPTRYADKPGAAHDGLRCFGGELEAPATMSRRDRDAVWRNERGRDILANDVDRVAMFAIVAVSLGLARLSPHLT
jgi:hypothetical protein